MVAVTAPKKRETTELLAQQCSNMCGVLGETLKRWLSGKIENELANFEQSLRAFLPRRNLRGRMRHRVQRFDLFIGIGTGCVLKVGCANLASTLCELP